MGALSDINAPGSNPTYLGSDAMHNLAEYLAFITRHNLDFDQELLEALLADLQQACKDGRLKYTTGKNPKKDWQYIKFPLTDVIRVIFDRPDLTPASALYTWQAATRKHPELIKYLQKISYAEGARSVKASKGVNSLAWRGVIYLASVLEYRPGGSMMGINNRVIYVLKDAGNKMLKIGYSANVERRIMEHKRNIPALIAIAFFPVNRQEDEQKLHKFLKPYRVPPSREWYSDTPEIRRAIRDYFQSDALSLD